MNDKFGVRGNRRYHILVGLGFRLLTDDDDIRTWALTHVYARELHVYIDDYDYFDCSHVHDIGGWVSLEDDENSDTSSEDYNDAESEDSPSNEADRFDESQKEDDGDDGGDETSRGSDRDVIDNESFGGVEGDVISHEAWDDIEGDDALIDSEFEIEEESSEDDDDALFEDNVDQSQNESSDSLSGEDDLVDVSLDLDECVQSDKEDFMQQHPVYKPAILGISGEREWRQTLFIPPLPPNFGRSVGRPARARRLEPDLASCVQDLTDGDECLTQEKRPTILPPAPNDAVTSEQDTHVVADEASQVCPVSQPPTMPTVGPTVFEQLQMLNEPQPFNPEHFTSRSRLYMSSRSDTAAVFSLSQPGQTIKKIKEEKGKKKVA
ncbi:hypothetical protein DH2020_028557 [Rehmannia glutinosa]|uniref:Uncharacterized protein n=1 Tax=Rehmannia glutinosa TaxID=99300 RepID=A0ABR0VQU9_REHGL